jgi:hypothetical protein
MAWSIFSQQNGDQLATAWAVELLQALGLQATPDRLQFVFDWERSEGGGGAYNPLNQGPVPGQPALTSTGQQYGGGASDFKGWQAGLLGAVAYLNMPNFRGVLQAMTSGTYASMAQALWASPWASGHYGYGNAWYTGKYPAMSPAQIAAVGNSVGLTGSGTAASQAAGLPAGGGAGNFGGGAPVSATGGAANRNPQVPGMGDIPALDAYIRQNFGSEAWLLDIPEVRNTLEQAVANGWTSSQVQASVQNTDWWKHTSQAQIAFDQIKFQTPEELNFADPGSKASQTLAHVMQLGSANGTIWSAPVMQQTALAALQYGWSDDQIRARLGSMVTVTPRNGGVVSNDSQLLAALTGTAGDYLINPNNVQLQQYARQIASGTATLDSWKTYLAGQAKAKYPTLAQQIDTGLTPNQIVDPLRQDAARIMETPADQINFMSNPMYQKILQYRPPDAGGKASPVRPMDVSEMETYLRGTDQWSYTQQARDQAASLEKNVVTTFGKVAAS